MRGAQSDFSAVVEGRRLSRHFVRFAESGYTGVTMICCLCCERNWPDSANSMLDVCFATIAKTASIANGIAPAQVRGL
jgi:hypothetical protein